MLVLNPHIGGFMKVVAVVFEHVSDMKNKVDELGRVTNFNINKRKFMDADGMTVLIPSIQMYKELTGLDADEIHFEFNPSLKQIKMAKRRVWATDGKVFIAGREYGSM